MSGSNWRLMLRLILHRLLAPIFLSLRSFIQWRVLWLAHHKFMIGVAGIVLDDKNRVLLLRHRYRSPDMPWGLPSGYVSAGETLEQSLAREIFEETGFTIQGATLLQLKSGFRLRVEVYFLTRLQEGELKIDPGEILEAAFFELHELPPGLPTTQQKLIERYAGNNQSTGQ